MRNLILLCFCLLVCSCSPIYQVQRLGVINANNDNNKLIFENVDIRVGFNFWSKGGDSGFAIFNKSNKTVYIDLGNSHFILNDKATTYFQDRSYTSGTSVRKSRGKTAFSVMPNIFLESGGISVESMSQSTTNEIRIVPIPPKTSKVFAGFRVVGAAYNANKFATKAKNTKTFNNQTSPIKIRNAITYRFNENDPDDNISFENIMYLKEITTYSKRKFLELPKNPRSYYLIYEPASSGSRVS